MADRISVREMAGLLGVSKSQVSRDAKAGMPMSDAAAASAWRRANVDFSRSAEGRVDHGREAPADAEPPDDDEPASTSDEYRRLRAERERIRVEREQLELDEIRGSLIDVAEASRLAYTAFRALRDAVLNVPARVKDALASETQAHLVEQLLDSELSKALAGFKPEAVTHDTDDDDEDEDAG